MEELFHIQFFSINAKAKAINKLKESAYYQESHIVKDYLDEFQILISKTKYIDLYTIVIKFKRGL